LLEKNANIFKEQGKALDQFAARDVKVLHHVAIFC
jgi:hypothetical protein